MPMTTMSTTMGGVSPRPYSSPFDFEIKTQQPSTDNFSKLLQHRTGSYNITKTSPIPDKQIVETVASALQRTPRKDDTTRVLVLFGKDRDALAETVRTVSAKKKSLKKEPARIQVLDKAHCVV